MTDECPVFSASDYCGKRKGNQGKDICKCPFLLWRAEVGGEAGFSCGIKSVFPDSNTSYKIVSLFSGCSIPWDYRALSMSFQSKSCLCLTVGVIINNQCFDSCTYPSCCHSGLCFYGVINLNYTLYLETTLKPHLIVNKCSPFISIAFKSELTR